MIRNAASVITSAMFVAATALTWWGVVAAALLCVLLIDMQRRVSRVLNQMDSVNERLDAQHQTVEQLRALVEGGPRADEA